MIHPIIVTANAPAIVARTIWMMPTTILPTSSVPTPGRKMLMMNATTYITPP